MLNVGGPLWLSRLRGVPAAFLQALRVQQDHSFINASSGLRDVLALSRYSSTVEVLKQFPSTAVATLTDFNGDDTECPFVFEHYTPVVCVLKVDDEAGCVGWLGGNGTKNPVTVAKVVDGRLRVFQQQKKPVAQSIKEAYSGKVISLLHRLRVMFFVPTMMCRVCLRLSVFCVTPLRVISCLLGFFFVLVSGQCAHVVVLQFAPGVTSMPKYAPRAIPQGPVTPAAPGGGAGAAAGVGAPPVAAASLVFSAAATTQSSDAVFEALKSLLTVDLSVNPDVATMRAEVRHWCCLREAVAMCILHYHRHWTDRVTAHQHNHNHHNNRNLHNHNHNHNNHNHNHNHNHNRHHNHSHRRCHHP